MVNDTPNESFVNSKSSCPYYNKVLEKKLQRKTKCPNLDLFKFSYKTHRQFLISEDSMSSMELLLTKWIKSS